MSQCPPEDVLYASLEFYRTFEVDLKLGFQNKPLQHSQVRSKAYIDIPEAHHTCARGGKIFESSTLKQYQGIRNLPRW